MAAVVYHRLRADRRADAERARHSEAERKSAQAAQRAVEGERVAAGARRFTAALLEVSRAPTESTAPFLRIVTMVVARTLGVGRASVWRSDAAGLLLLDLYEGADAVAVAVETAVALGLVLNEPLTNAFKYGLPPETGRARASGAAADVAVEVRVDGEGLLLAVRDSGLGLPADVDLAGASTLGLQLVRSPVRPLRGPIAAERTPRALVVLRSPRRDRTGPGAARAPYGSSVSTTSACGIDVSPGTIARKRSVDDAPTDSVRSPISVDGLIGRWRTSMGMLSTSPLPSQRRERAASVLRLVNHTRTRRGVDERPSCRRFTVRS